MQHFPARLRTEPALDVFRACWGFVEAKAARKGLELHVFNQKDRDQLGISVIFFTGTVPGVVLVQFKVTQRFQLRASASCDYVNQKKVSVA